MIIALTLLVALVGVLMYVLAANPKLQEIGRIAFFCGLLAFLMNRRCTADRDNQMNLTPDKLRSLLVYDPETGSFTRRIATGYRGCHKAGTVAGTNEANGYIRICVDGKQYWAHRLAFLYMTGEWPLNVDHIDGDKSNTKWSNLRSVTRSLNMQNRKGPTIVNKVGMLGVHQRGARFFAYIKSAGRNKFLGSFQTASLAHDAYIVAKRDLHPGNTL